MWVHEPRTACGSSPSPRPPLPAGPDSRLGMSSPPHLCATRPTTNPTFPCPGLARTGHPARPALAAHAPDLPPHRPAWAFFHPARPATPPRVARPAPPDLHPEPCHAAFGPLGPAAHIDHISVEATSARPLSQPAPAPNKAMSGGEHIQKPVRCLRNKVPSHMAHARGQPPPPGVQCCWACCSSAPNLSKKKYPPRAEALSPESQHCMSGGEGGFSPGVVQCRVVLYFANTGKQS